MCGPALAGMPAPGSYLSVRSGECSGPGRGRERCAPLAARLLMVCAVWLTVALNTPEGVFAFVGAPPPGAVAPPGVASPVVLGAALCQGRDGTVHRLVLWREYVAPPVSVSELNAWNKTHIWDYVNTCWTLVDTSLGKSPSRRVVWALPEHQEIGYGWACVVGSAASGRAYVVVSRSQFGLVSFSVYPVDPSANVGKFPLDLSCANFRSWPSPPEPLAWLYGAWVVAKAGDGGCGVWRIQAVPEANGSLLVYGERDEPDCLPIAFRVDPAKNRWVRATLRVAAEGAAAPAGAATVPR